MCHVRVKKIGVRAKKGKGGGGAARLPRSRPNFHMTRISAHTQHNSLRSHGNANAMQASSRGMRRGRREGRKQDSQK